MSVDLSRQQVHFISGRFDICSLTPFQCLGTIRMVLKIGLSLTIIFFCLFAATDAEELQKKDALNSPLAYVLEIPADYIGYAKEAVRKDYLDAYLIGAGIMGASLLLDEPMRNYFQRDQCLSDVRWMRDEVLGSAGTYNTLFAGMFIAGYTLDQQGLSDTAVMGFEKLILDMNIGQLLKNNVSRRRPNDKNNDSFTSGHTTPPASFASTVSTMSGWNPWITGISYSISIFTGLIGIEGDQHWFSDIVASHVFPTLTAKPMSKYWKSKNVIVLPDVDDQKTGMVFAFRF